MIEKELKNDNINLRIEPSVKKQFEQAAAANGERSIAAVLYKLIKEYIETVRKK